MSVVDIPSWVKGIQPNIIKVPLESYSTKGELFAQEEQIERFFSERWINVPEGPGISPHVFVMDFVGVRTLNPENVNGGLGFVLSNFIGRRRRAYAVFDNLAFEGENNPWKALNLTVEQLRRTRGIAVARREGDERYQLIGKRRFTKGRWQDIFTRLSTEGDWVEGRAFATEDFNLPIKPAAIRDYLYLMAKKGVILQVNSGRFSYYRSLV